ncbi:hypothetical protein LS71_007430 [Helicobacter jaachi]|uniref:Uncharacterized protein n=1 Tax=Helicobacter jaachi TaxID=1677920 RepID=A0A4U8TBR7_9HELI|nr:hypothetical protein [Helicobacter jaachi]TLD96067.1 hypothetical protein LS71_007430 [Helicobacter jaachi]
MHTPYTTKNGEITTKEDLIQEIEALLNQLPAKSPTTLSISVMSVMSCRDLENVRDGLLSKQKDIIARNQQWLIGLAHE